MELPCISGFITPKAVCPGGIYVRPKSGLHVEDLPGISTTALAAVEPGKYLDAQTFIDEKMKVAGMIIADRMRNHLEAYIEERGVREAGYIGTWSVPDVTLVGADVPRGVRVKADGGPMLVPTISRVYIKGLDAISDLVVKLKDGEKVTEFPVSIEAGIEKELYLNYDAEKRTVDIYIDDERFIPFSGSTEGTKYFSSCLTCGGHSRYLGIAGSALYDGAETDVLQGIRAEAVLLCSIEPVLCLLLSRFRWAMLYQWGILVLEEWLASPRTNYFTIHSKAWAADKVEQWNMIDLPRAMKSNIQSLASFISQLDPDCLTCGKGPGYANSHP